jgi:glyceraldehyde 3-phosphate dehydrogenase
MATIAINGLGRIGRAALKIALETRGLDVVAINGIAPRESLVYLLRYDTV